MVLALALFSCERAEKPEPGTPEPVGDDDDTTTPPVTAPTTPCASATIGVDGGELAHAGVVLTVPPDALGSDTEVELCTNGVADGFSPVSLVVEILPDALEPAVPVEIALPYEDATGGVALWAEDAEGELVRQIRATDQGTSFASPLYRFGTVFVAPDDRVTESYVPVGASKADLLFVVDNSCSMSDEQAQLAADFGPLFDDLLASGLDFHVGVTSTDCDGTYNGSRGTLRSVTGLSWVDADTASPTEVFEAMVRMGTAGSATEKGLGGAYLALETEADQANAGFQRDDAELAVIVVSDEPDLTPASLISPQEFATWFEQLKPDPASTTFHGLIDPNIGATYASIATNVGGTTANIAQGGWGAFFLGVLDLFEVGSMALASPAEDGTVEVWVIPADGSEPYALDADEWTWNADTNAVQVDPTSHGEDDEVVVLYVPA